MFQTFFKWPRSRRSASNIRRRSRFRPALEILEDRQAPAVLTVNSVADNTSTDSALTLREAIQVVNGTLGRSLTTAEKTLVAGTLGSSDKILFSLPVGRQTITLTGGALSITRAVTVAGPGSDVLSISGNHASRVFVIGNIYSRNLSLVAAISGLTVANGTAVSGSNNFGAGMLNFGTLTVSDCVFTGNAAGSSGGGGIYNNGAMTVSNCTFSANSVTNVGAGGGLFNTGSATLTVVNCTFSANTGVNGSSGGGLSNSGTATVTGCTFSGNSVASNGAGIHNSSSGKLTLSNSSFVNGNCVSDGGGLDSDGTLTISNCTFSNNVVGSEGGAIDSHGTLTITNCTLAGNTAVSRGGALNISGQSQITNCTITGNRVSSSSGNGGGIYDSVAAKVCNTIVTGNFVGKGTTASDIVGAVATTSAFNLIGNGGSGGLANGVNGNQVGVTNPGINALASNGGPTQTIALLSGSPAIDRGSNAFVPAGATDQRGLVRIVNRTVDIGAFEVQSSGTQTASSFLVAGFSSPAIAGAAGAITVTAKDASGNTVAGFTGTVHFTSSDPQAVLPADYTFVAGDNGSRSFNVALKTAGSQSVTVTTTGAPSIAGTQASITVTPAAAMQLVIMTQPSATATAGTTFVTQPVVAEQDSFGNVITSDSTHTVSAASSGTAGLQGITTITLANGVATFTNLSYNKAETIGISFTTNAGAFSVTSSSIVVSPASSQLVILTQPSSNAMAGAAFTTQPVVAEVDQFGNIIASDNSHVVTAASTGTASLQGTTTITLVNGVATFTNLAYNRAETIQLRFTINSPGASSAASDSIAVAPAPASTLTVAGFPSPITVGVAGSFTVVAQDAFGNTAIGYAGTVRFTSSDGDATLPPDSMLTGGAGSFTAAFATSGSQALSATDTLTPSINGTQAGIAVNPVGPAPGLTVNSSADNTTADNLLTLREAIAVVDGNLGRALTSGEQAQIVGPLGPNINIQFSLPAGPQTITLTAGALNITQPITINGPGAANLTVSGNNQNRVFIVGHDYSQNLGLHVAINGLTIAGGSAVVAGRNYGGGLLNFGTLSLTGITFRGNVAGNSGGGGIYNDGALTVSDSTFTGNSVNAGGPGGAIQNATPATLTVTGCTFSANTATAGASGAAIANSGAATIAGCTIAGNSADSNAGGIYNSSEGNLIVTACTIANNTCGSDGAGIDNDGAATISASTLSGNSAGSEGGGMDSKGPLTMTNCTLHGNTAVSDGGGLTTSASALITNCTITANRVTAGSSGIFGGGIRDQGVAARIYNTIVAGNFRGPAPSTTPDDVAGSVDLASAFNLIGTGGSGGLTNGVNSNQVGIANAGLGTLADNGGPTPTVALLTGSLAIDHGSNARVTAGETDQRGRTRIVGGTVDIGAFEVQ